MGRGEGGRKKDSSRITVILGTHGPNGLSLVVLKWSWGGSFGRRQGSYPSTHQTPLVSAVLLFDVARILPAMSFLVDSLGGRPVHAVPCPTHRPHSTSSAGATCYLNVLLQTLFMTPEFRSMLYHYHRTPVAGAELPPESATLPPSPSPLGT